MKYLFAAFIFTAILSCTETAEKKHVLPFVGNFDVEYKMIDGKEVADTIYPKMVSFAYLNQDSVMIKSSYMKGKVWIADFFFTSCPSICPKMTNQMKRLSENTRDLKDHVQFMSFSINPKTDGPARLREYIKLHDIKAKNWNFFTGNENATHRLGIENFQIFAGEDASAAGGYAHSPAFTLVDKEGYVRGVYTPATDNGPVDQLEKDLRKLLKYEYNVTGAEKN